MKVICLLQVQWDSNGGKCGVCGDNYQDPTPRDHELGGMYGQGVIVKTYRSGGKLPVGVNITANHHGHFRFKICNLDKSKGVESNACFNKYRLRLTNGEERYVVPTFIPDTYKLTLRIPKGLRCKHCVLQWTYVAGNNWGVCKNGTTGVGCGNQEHFRACSDIRIK